MGGERPPVPGVRAEDDTGRTGGQVTSYLPPHQSRVTPEGFVGAGDLLLAADLLQVVSLLAEVITGPTAILAGRDSAVRIVTVEIETRLTVIVNTGLRLLHLNSTLRRMSTVS